MKNIMLALLVFVPLSFLFSSSNPDDILGKWINSDGNRKMEIYKDDNNYFGKIIWLKDSDDKAKVGDIILKDFKYEEDEWKGKIYFSAKKRDMSGTITMEDSTTIKITAKIGLFGKSKEWKRVDK